LNEQETAAVHAIIEDSGTQIRVSPGDIIDIDLRDLADDAKTIVFERVLLLGDEGEAEATIGTPYVEGATVTAEVLDEIKDDKIDVIKFKRRKGYRVKKGHRQRYLRVRVQSVKA